MGSNLKLSKVELLTKKFLGGLSFLSENDWKRGTSQEAKTKVSIQKFRLQILNFKILNFNQIAKESGNFFTNRFKLQSL